MPSILILLFLTGSFVSYGIQCGNSFVLFTNTDRRRPRIALSSTTTGTSTVIHTAALLDEILQVAVDASKKAGAIILGHASGAAVTERKANPRDLLTLMDPICEQVRQTVVGTKMARILCVCAHDTTFLIYHIPYANYFLL